MAWPQTTCDVTSGINVVTVSHRFLKQTESEENCFIDRGGQLPSSNPTPLLYMFKKIATLCRLPVGYGAMLRAA